VSDSGGLVLAGRKRDPPTEVMTMTTVVRRDRTRFGDLLDWIDGELRLLPTVRAAATGHGIRCEDYVEDGRYVVRAEIPGVDPTEDIEVSVMDGVLTVNAQRSEEHREGGCSEFRYGVFTRSVLLPDGADESDVTARYADGILLVEVGLTGEEQPRARRIPVTAGAAPAAEGEPPTVAAT
jgi:HSP20 family molecular chaperone IbpA